MNAGATSAWAFRTEVTVKTRATPRDRDAAAAVRPAQALSIREKHGHATGVLEHDVRQYVARGSQGSDLDVDRLWGSD